MTQLFFSSAEALPRYLFWGALLLRVALAAFFVLLAAKNLGGDAHMAHDFRRWGYSLAFQRLVALAQVAGAVVLVFPSVCFWGGLLLVVLMLGAIATHLVHDPPATALAPLVVGILVAVSVVSFRPPLLR